MTGAISQDRQRCQFPFVLDEKPTVVPERSAESGQEARERFFMEQLARTQSAWRVGLRGQAIFGSQIVWNRSTQIADSGWRIAGTGCCRGARDGRPRRLRVLTMNGESSIAAMILKAPPQLG